MHFSIGKPIEKELEHIKDIPNKNDQIKELALIIDNHIYNNYKLWPNNYIAYDVMTGQEGFSSEYTPEEKQKFLSYLDDRITKVPGEPGHLKQIMIRMYGNPVKNKLGAQ